ncbi:HAD family hydrolase [Psychromicrobium lacuslunae]|uniref:Haloacid dehalogenase n=1 Tax=Psychromicrobium lacuslunae TaxID=1618207 RepID=A0A0D4BYU9_9MICC|nr:HAD family phosphatase [Psychromicrobium lacuslunae]AJT41320.1 haloacid dehalogenase [Psychromicrobium lacuslunae]
MNWYLFDYGMVISQPPTAADWEALAEASGFAAEPESSAYWQHRRGYDAGELSTEQYWQRVLGRSVSSGQLAQLHALDVRAWSHLNGETLDVLEAIDSTGAGLALLSNMPVELAKDLGASSVWPRFFSKLYFSGQLGLVKPDAQIYQHVLDDLAVPAAQVTFIDDRQENLDAAAALGFNTVLHTPETDLAVELKLSS